MESLSPTERDIGNGSNPAEKSNHSLQQQNPLAEHSSQRQSGDGSESNSLVTDSLSTLSISAEPFKSTSFDQSAATQLSVFAKEFVPKTFPTTSYTESYQTYVDTEYHEQTTELAPADSERSDPLLDYAFQVLYEITYSPGHFTHLCDQLISNLNSWPALDESMLQILVDEIVALAIREPNFRYNGARLCNSITRGLRISGPTSPDFRSTLFNRCRIIHDDRKNLMQSDAEYLRGFALFMSELFVHMNQKDASSRFRVLGRAVRELLLTLLEHPTPGNVKCVCQILKLSGSYLEDDDREANKGKTTEMDQLMAKIETVGRTVEMQMHMKDLLLNMIELRGSDWGRAPSSPVTRESHTASSQLPNHQMGVYYGPDGQALTAEETEFLDQGINRHDEDEEYEYAYEEDTGMDDEMAEAFEKFLMMQDALK
ncbi:polyadenylate-binding protein-interacting protein 1-like [Daphnia pulex]|uniref:polyadenylate-binding protein-interacting protein 1-like n=1 Tax=Daphnia pulex TaxID=6669 RepID=UPI001EDD3EC9|nr:polyadenylate-binding protein-interacting protein 1-like [Daphnia pulex]